jgi:hypothetical protein
VSADLVAHFVQPACGDDHGQADDSLLVHPLAESIRHRDPRGRSLDGRRRVVGPPCDARATHFAPQVHFLKDEVFDICGALALGESLFNRLGRPNEAAYLATIFDVVEGRLVEPLSPLTTG